MPSNKLSRYLLYCLASFMLCPTVALSEPVNIQVKSVVQKFLKAWETNDKKVFSNALHRDVEFSYPGGRLGKQDLLKLFSNYQNEKKDIKIYFWDEFFIQNDKFASAYQFAATDKSSDKRQAVGTGIIGQMKNGRIILLKEYYDEDVAVLQYQGKLPLDEGIVTPWPSSIWLRPDLVD